MRLATWALLEFAYVGAISEALVEFNDDCLHDLVPTHDLVPAP